MRRLILSYLIPLLLPFAAYALWLALVRWRARRAGAEVPGWNDAPLTWLMIAGIALASMGFVYLGLREDAPPEAKYQPPHMENGVIVPGRFE